MICPNCNATVPDTASFCTYCGTPLPTSVPGARTAPPQSAPPMMAYGTLPQTIIIQTVTPPTPAHAPATPRNNAGTAGFILALASMLFSWTLTVGGIIWLLGLIFSVSGMSRPPRRLAVAGFIICVPAIILIAVISRCILCHRFYGTLPF